MHLLGFIRNLWEFNLPTAVCRTHFMVEVIFIIHFFSAMTVHDCSNTATPLLYIWGQCWLTGENHAETSTR